MSRKVALLLHLGSPVPVVLGDVLEGAVSQTAPHLVLVIVGQVDVEGAVSVVVADGDAHAVAGRLQSAGVGNIDETGNHPSVLDSQVVPKKAIAERLRNREQRLIECVLAAQEGSLSEVRVEIAVAVEVEQSAALSGHLREVVSADHAVEVPERGALPDRSFLEKAVGLGGSLGSSGRRRSRETGADQEDPATTRDGQMASVDGGRSPKGS